MKSIFLSLSTFLITFALISFHACTTEPIIGPVGVNDGTPINEGMPCENGIISFKDEILPLVVSSCAYDGCHDATTAADDIVLDSYENIMKEVTPYKPNRSELYEVLNEGGDDRMPPPPNEALNNDQKNLIKDWINQGAANTACDGPCDPEKSSFAQDIFPVIQTFCIGCHSDAQALGNVNLKDYAHIKPYVDNGALLGTIEHVSGYNPMPPAGGMMADCRIAQIQKWIAEGAQNN